jgi:hypothetical protein
LLSVHYLSVCLEFYSRLPLFPVESYLIGVLRFILMAERNTARRERQYISQ